jgi:IS5 family transposase
VADGQIPISCLLTAASLHDSQAAIPLATMTASRVASLYDVMDSAYDARETREHSRSLGHVPIIAWTERTLPVSKKQAWTLSRGDRRRLPTMEKLRRPRTTPPLTPAEEDRLRERTMSERVNSRLKDEFGGRHIRVRGAAKVMAHLMFGVLALTVDQLLKLIR